MNNKDILKRAQQENKDEREEQIKTKAFHVGWLTVIVVMLFLIFFRNYFNESANDILMILMAQVASFSFYLYFKLRHRKGYLISGIMGTVAFFYHLLLYSVSTECIE